jgi:DNA-binding CsgD family transcriptional regulator
MPQTPINARTKAIRLAIDVTHRAELWPELCDAMARTLGGTAFMVFEYDFRSLTAPIFRGSRAVGKAMHLVTATMEGRLPEVEIAGYRRFAAFPAGRLVGEYECYDITHDRDLPENPYRDAVFAASGAASRSVMRVNDIGPWSDVAALHLKCPAAETPPEVRAEAEFLLPLLGRTIEASRTMNGLSRMNVALMAAFDQLDFGAAICTGTGQILVSNAEFRAIAAERDGLLVLSGTAQPVDPADREGFLDTLRASPDLKTPGSLHICRLRRRSSRLPLIARAIPIRGAAVAGRDDLLSLLLVVDPLAPDRVNADGINALGVLSQAELDVCRMIVDGHTTAEIATLRDTSVQTATDQIKSALSKLACATRLDIVRIAMATRVPGRGSSFGPDGPSFPQPGDGEAPS